MNADTPEPLLDEFRCGSFFLTLGLFDWLAPNSPGDFYWTKVFTLGVGLVAAIVAAHYGIDQLRKRVISRRTRYVGGTSQTPLTRNVCVAILVSSIPVYVLARTMAGFAPKTGLLTLAIPMLYTWWFARQVGWKQLIGLMLALGGMVIDSAPAAALGLGDDSRSGFMLLFSGVTMLLSGSISLRQHLNDTKPLSQEAQ